MAKLVTIFGGSGFVGRYVAQRMARQGWRVRVAVRRPNEAMFVKTYGAVGQVEPLLCNVRDDASVRDALAGADAVVNCVGILVEAGRNRFDAIHNQAATRIARLAAQAGVGQLVHVSALGADVDAASNYGQSKGLGEQGVQKYFPKSVILRPSVIFGTEDKFFNKFSALAGLGPVLPIVGGSSKMQPVYVDDVAHAVVVGVLGQAKPGVYELGGPKVDSLRAILSQMLDVIERRRLILNFPFPVGTMIGVIFDAIQTVSLGLIINSVLTRDQVKSLRNDSVVAPGARGFDALGITPTEMEIVLPEYLWPYRPSGQYAEIKASAKDLSA